MIEFNATFIDGPYAGRTAKLKAAEFRVGLRLNVEGIIYKVCDGPVAQTIELQGRGHDNLVVALRLDPDSKPGLEK